MSNVEQNPNVNTPDQDDDDEAVSLFTQLAGVDSSDSTDADVIERLDQGLSDDDQTQDVSANPQSEQLGQADDPWAAAPEPLRESYQQLQQKHQQLEDDHRANAGRVAALNRKALELQQALEAREKAGAKPSTDADMPSASDLEGKTFEEIEDDFPDIAAFVRNQVAQIEGRLQKQLAPVNEIVSEKRQQQETEVINNELARLASVHPDYLEVSQDPSFSQWITSQPQSVQSMYGSLSADDNIALLTLFKGSTGRIAAQQSKATSAPRKTNLSDHAEIPRKGGGRAAVDPDGLDPVELFNLISKS